MFMYLDCFLNKCATDGGRKLVKLSHGFPTPNSFWWLYFKEAVAPPCLCSELFFIIKSAHTGGGGEHIEHLQINIQIKNCKTNILLYFIKYVLCMYV